MFDASSYDTTMSETPNKNTCQKIQILFFKQEIFATPSIWMENTCGFQSSHQQKWYGIWRLRWAMFKWAWIHTEFLTARKLPFSLDNTTQAETHPQISVIFLLSFYIRILAMNPLAIGSVYFRIVSLFMSFHCHFKAHFSHEAHTWQSHKNCQD